MGRSVYLVRTRSPPATCIVNDAHLGSEGVCGRAAAEGRECAAPVCANHLCQYRHSNGHRCKDTPLRLAQGVMNNAVGWFPNTSASANCARHEKHNCIGFVNDNGTVRCSGTKDPGRDHCPVHAASLCKWKHREGRLCPQEALPGSRYCRGHCCAVQNEQGMRCARRRCRSSPSLFCNRHRCVWKRDAHTRCDGSSYPNRSPGVCGGHTCVKEGCGNGAHNGVDRCGEHVCAFQPPGRSKVFPACAREPIEGQRLCELHEDFVRCVGQGAWMT